MSGDASSEKRIRVAQSICEALDDFDLDDREQVTTIFCAIAMIWRRKGLPVELFGEMAAATGKQMATMEKPPEKAS